MDLPALKQLAYESMENKSSHPWKERGNKYYHGQRVAKLALTLRKNVLPGDKSHDDIITVAAWFHDICNGNENHAELGATKLNEMLQGYCTDGELKKICEIISNHCDRKPNTNIFSDYVKLHQDADLLDHFGTFDIMTEFIYALHQDKSIIDIIAWFNNRTSEYEKFRQELNFELSRDIFDEKSDFVHKFAERFNIEGVGGIYNEELIFHYFYNKQNY